MGRIIQKNNGKTTVFVTGENISALTPEAGSYFVGPDLSSGDYTILNPEGEVFNLETNYMTGGTYNSTGGTLTISGPNYNISISGFSTGGTGTFEVIDITYTELYNSIVNGLLIPGSWYRLTDYRSVNFLNGWRKAQDYSSGSVLPVDPNYNPYDVHTGDTETLLLQAITEYDLSKTAYSEKYPNDIIEFDAFTNSIGVDIEFSNGYTLPDSSVVSGFDLMWDSVNQYVYVDMPVGYTVQLGHYFYVYAEFNDGVNDYYQDGNFEPITPNIAYCQYDYSSGYGSIRKATSRLRITPDGSRVIFLDLVESDVTNYILNTLYIETIRPIAPAYGWVTKRIDKSRKITVPFDFRGRKYRRFEINLGDILPIYGLGYYSIGDNYNGVYTTGNYLDYYVFGNNGDDVYDIEWDDAGGPDAYWYNGYNDNNVFFDRFNNNIIGVYNYNNTCGYFANNKTTFWFVDNIITSSFNDNTLLSYFQYNIFIDFNANLTRGGFYSNKGSYNISTNQFGSVSNNIIGGFMYENNIKGSFTNNVIGDSMTYNNIDVAFQSNSIGNNFTNNRISNGFFGNTVLGGFRNNDVVYSISSTNFSTSTHVYNDYNCKLFRASNNVNYLEYFNGTSLQYVAVNA